MYSLHTLRRSGRLPYIPVYVDSPLTVNITQVFRLHPECYDADARALLQSGDSPFEFDGLRYISAREDSMALNTAKEPCVVISASGMCEAGRVLHHSRATIENPKDTALIVGFQAQHTLGRRIVERRPRVRILGVERRLAAEVVVMNGFSAHGDQSDLLAYAESVRASGPLRDVLLVHGEPTAQDVLRKQLEARGFSSVRTPVHGDIVDV